MNDTARLEHWYRRMLTWYPAEHRRTYGEEMIGVLLASAPQGRRRPGIADTLDLVKGSLLARLRPADGHADAGWRDTFAVFSIAAPAMTVAYYLAVFAVPLITKHAPLAYFAPVIFVVKALLIVLVFAISPLLALVPRLRWPAIATVTVLAIAFGYFMIQNLAYQASPDGNTPLVWYSIFFVLELAALVISPGPRRGAAIMTRPAWAVTAGVAGLAGLATGLVGSIQYQTATLIFNVTMPVAVVAVVIGLVLTLPAPIGARLLLLLAIPGYPIATAIATTASKASVLYYSTTPGSLALMFVPTTALAGLVAALAWRSRDRGSAAS